MSANFTGLSVARGGTGLFIDVTACFDRARTHKEDVECPKALRAFGIFEDISHVLERQYGVMDKATTADLFLDPRNLARLEKIIKPDEFAQITALYAEYQGLLVAEEQPIEANHAEVAL